MPSHKAKRNEVIHSLAAGVLHSYEMLINAHMDRLEQIAAETQLNNLDEVAGLTKAIVDTEVVLKEAMVRIRVLESIIGERAREVER